MPEESSCPKARDTVAWLVCCYISGYGDSGDYRQMKAYDLLVQCESGMASITGTPDARKVPRLGEHSRALRDEF